MLINKLSNYKPLNLQKPDIPIRSRLYYLKPMGVGTAYVESLTGYIARLAEAHCVSTNILITTGLAPFINKGYVSKNKHQGIASIFGSDKHTHTLNGIGVNSKAVVDALQLLTLRNDLYFLTMLIWSEVLPWRGLIRPVKAWRPTCYQSWQREELAIYEPLIWGLNVVKICPQHYQRLRTICKHCGKQISSLMNYSRPGYCSYCRNWLGDFSVDDSEVLDNLELRQQRWVLRNVEDLLTAAPTLLSIPSKERLIRNIVFCINQVTGGNRSAFSRLFKIFQRDDVYSWYSGENKPPLNRLLQLCNISGTSLLDFLTTDILSVDLGKLTTQIPSEQKHQQKPQNFSKQRDFEQMQQVLQSSLSQFPPKPIMSVIKQLGSSKPFLVRHFPDLYYAISSRYTDYKKALLEQERLALEAVLESNEYPPPSLREVARRLESEHNHLNTQFPEIFRVISKRYLDYRKACGIAFREKIRQQIRQVALELHTKGQLPHGEVMGKYLLKPGIMRTRAAQIALNEIRLELGYDK